MSGDFCRLHVNINEVIHASSVEFLSASRSKRTCSIEEREQPTLWKRIRSDGTIQIL